MLRIRRSRFPLLVIVLFIVYLLWQNVFPDPRNPSFFTLFSPCFVRSTFDWSRVPQKYPLPAHELRSPPRGEPLELPRVQHDFSASRKRESGGEAGDNGRRIPEEELERRRGRVRNVFLRGWRNYEQLAWLKDELGPVSGVPRNPFGGWAATLVDSLDSLWILGLESEFEEAVRAVGKLDWAETQMRSINLFETTIRHLAGLLSAYDLSGDETLLAKARELGDMLYMAFDTPNRIPSFWFSFDTALSGKQSAGESDPTAAIGSLCMEFTRLSHFTGDHKYYDATDRVKDLFQRTQNQTRLPGLWPMTMSFRRESVDSSVFTLGASADSLYEYLPKMYILLGGLDSSYKDMAIWSLETARKHLFFRPMTRTKADVLFSGKVYASNPVAVEGDETPPEPTSTLSPSSEHLTCFTGGMYLLAGRTFSNEDYVSLGLRLARGCAWAYSVFRTGIMPETFEMATCPEEERSLQACEWDQEHWDTGGTTNFADGGFRYVRDSRYLLRPEAIESVFYAYRVTGDEEWLDTAWRMFESIEMATETKLGNAAIVNVNAEGETKKIDSMESFWFSETLKYFYLIFSPPDVISLDDYVFNTEAHPFRRPKPTQDETA